jgi:biotin carboxylase
MSEHIGRSGVPIPDQRPASSDARVLEAIGQLGLPVVIKGASGRGGQATRICDTPAEACVAARELRVSGSTPFAQRFIRGTTCLAGGLFDRGRALRFFAGRKTVQYPARTGPAAEIISDADAALREVATRVFAAANVTGLASIDLVRDDRGSYHFLELNPRPWGSIDAAQAAGVDLFEALAALWRSESVEANTSFAVGRRVPIFPLYLLSAPCWREGHLAAAIRGDLAAAAGFAVHQPRQALHQLHRLLRVGLNWSQPLFHR